MGSFIAQKPFSAKYYTYKTRIKRLTDDKYMAGIEANNKRYVSKAASKRVLDSADRRKNDLNKCNGSLKKRIQHHLSKGRDAGRIATWENLRVSDVQKIIEEIKP